MKAGSGPPQVSDFSQKAIQKAVIKTGLSHWLTLYPPAIGLPCGLAGLLFNSPALYLISLSAFFVGLGSAIVNVFFRNESIASSYIEQLNRAMREHERIVLTSLHKDLQACSSIKGAEQHALQGAEQFRRIQEKYQNVRSLLEKKLTAGELTFGRFVGAAEQVYLSGLDNLKRVVATLQSAGSIDPDYIEDRLKNLAGMEQLSEADKKEVETLKRRLKLREEQFHTVNDLLTKNEEAMTEIEETTAAIAAMQTVGKFSTTDFETAISQLQEMAERTRFYKNT